MTYEQFRQAVANALMQAMLGMTTMPEESMAEALAVLKSRIWVFQTQFGGSYDQTGTSGDEVR